MRIRNHNVFASLMAVWVVAAGMAHAGPARAGAASEVADPRDVTQLWAGYDPRKLPLEIEVEKEWIEDGVRFRKVYFTGEVWEGEKVRVFAYTGVPVKAQGAPGVLHIHGGGQTANLEWVKFWTRRGYGAVSLDWCGKYSTREDYTRWGRLKCNMMLDPVVRTVKPSVRYSPWYHWALVSRRALTLLESQPGVDRSRLGVFGVSMGATITWMMAGCDPRVKTAAPVYGCGWTTYAEVIPRDSYPFPVPAAIELWRGTMEPETYARYVTCPLLLLSATNDFFTDMDRAYDTLSRVEADTRQSFTLRYGHHLEPPQGRTLALWMDHTLKSGDTWAKTPRISLGMRNGALEATVAADQAGEVEKVEIVYAVGSRIPEARFWRGTTVMRDADTWRAALPIPDPRLSVRALVNVTYRAGYTLSSAEAVAVPSTLGTVLATEPPSRVIDTFAEGTSAWNFGLAYTDPWLDRTYERIGAGPDGGAALTLNPDFWGDGEIRYEIGTYKVGDPTWTAPPGAALGFSFRGEVPSTLEIHAWVDHWGTQMKEYKAQIPLDGSGAWQRITVTAHQCRASDGTELPAWSLIDRLDFTGTSPAHKPPLFTKVEWR